MSSYIDIAPSVGVGLVFAQNQPGGYNAIDDRAFNSVGLQEGVVDRDDGGWEVTERSAGANMSVDVATDVGNALVQGDTIAHQELYLVRPHSSAVNLDIGTADGSLPRVDLVVLEAKDDEHDGSGLTRARVYVLEGTPTAGATKEDWETYAETVPDSTLPLAAVQVDAAASSITDSDILDLRVSAVPVGADRRIGVIASDGSIVASSGLGFTVTKTATGTYQVDFVPEFENAPVVVCTAQQNNRVAAFNAAPTTAQVTFTVYEASSGTLSNTGVHFTAEDPGA